MAVPAVLAVAATKHVIDSQFWNRRDLNRAELTAPAKARHREPAGEDSFARGSVMVAQPTCSTRLLGDQAVEIGRATSLAMRRGHLTYVRFDLPALNGSLNSQSARASSAMSLQT